MNYHNINELENMCINLLEFGPKEVWLLIEQEKRPLKRCELRKCFAIAIKKLHIKEGE